MAKYHDAGEAGRIYREAYERGKDTFWSILEEVEEIVTPDGSIKERREIQQEAYNDRMRDDRIRDRD